MPIPERQFTTWSNLGATQTAISMHNAIRTALTGVDSLLTNRGFREGNDYEIYLQGSYRNRTNIYGDSDVDVVVQVNRTYVDNTEELASSDLQLYNSRSEPASYSWNECRNDVLDTLRSAFGNRASEGNKSVKIARTSYQLGADVVPCFQFRYYWNYRVLAGGRVSESYEEGIAFYTRREGRFVVNYPKQHYQNGSNKNRYQTGGNYKPLIRVFKNARNTAITKGILADGVAPSYFVESLLYNVPNPYFTSNYRSAFGNILDWLNDEDISSFDRQNGQSALFGWTPEQWTVSQARQFIAALISLWNDW